MWKYWQNQAWDILKNLKFLNCPEVGYCVQAFGELLVESPYTSPVQTNNSLALLGLDRQIMPILVKLNDLILKS